MVIFYIKPTNKIASFWRSMLPLMFSIKMPPKSKRKSHLALAREAKRLKAEIAPPNASISQDAPTTCTTPGLPVLDEGPLPLSSGPSFVDDERPQVQE